MSEQPVADGWRIPDALWEQIAPLLPPQRTYLKGGRPRIPDCQAMDAICFILRTGSQWQALPHSLSAASTVHDWFQAWRDAGMCERMWRTGLLASEQQVGIDWEWHTPDGAMTNAPLG